MTSPVQATRQADDEPGCQAFTTTTEPSSWMPLEGLAQTWAAFAGTFLTRPA